jgi:hypothetical protein
MSRKATLLAIFISLAICSIGTTSVSLEERLSVVVTISVPDALAWWMIPITNLAIRKLKVRRLFWQGLYIAHVLAVRDSDYRSVLSIP